MVKLSPKRENMNPKIRKAKRYLGLELMGAKNPKTALAIIEYYPKEHKIFLLDIHEKLGSRNGQDSDTQLIGIVNNMKKDIAKIGVNVPITLPPCATCTRKTCPLPEKCTVPSVKWMRSISKRNPKKSFNHNIKSDFTPYTQRPVELWVKWRVFSTISEFFYFDIDEALGGSKAPLTARMQFIKRHIPEKLLLETWPKLTVSVLSQKLKIGHKTFRDYRQIEVGPQSRMQILEQVTKDSGIFIYENDLRILSENLSTFDAFLCAYMALLHDLNHCEKIPHNFPVSSGWIWYPE